MRPLVLLLLMIGGLPAVAQWYESDRFGIAGERIDEDAPESYEYSLFVERSVDSEERSLFQRGVLQEIALLQFVNDRLQSVERRVGDEIVETETYRYWRDGSLRSVVQETDVGRRIEYRYRDGSLYQEWANAPGSSERIDYDSVGRSILRVLWLDNVEAERETREYWGPGSGDPLRTVTLVADGTETVRSYDEMGRLLGSSTTAAGEVQSRIIRVFENGLLVEERDEQSDPQRLWRYTYEGDLLVGEHYFEDEEIVRSTRYDSDEADRVESIYTNGEAGLRVYYVNERRIREELLRNGEVIRTRRFEPEEASP